MKIKKDKKLEKRPRDEETSEQPKDAKKSNKKAKMQKIETENGDEATATQPTPASDKALKTVDANIFKYFNELTNDEEKTRMEAALHLLQQIQRTKEPEKRQRELAYTLKRLIRGCGASTNVSRAGFFTGLVGFLKSFNNTELSIDEVFGTLKKELNVGATVANKEDADAFVGKILVCGALLHSGRLSEATSEHLEKITNILLQSSRHRTYHASLGFSFLCEILENLSQEEFESSVWPHLQKELTKSWSKQSLQTVHCLITLQKKFPDIVNAKFLKANFGGKELLNPESFQYLHKIFWEHSNTDILTHPAFECFGAYIATSKYLSQFWCDVVDPGLKNPTKLLEVETLKIFTDILDNLNVEKTNVHELLSDNFMLMFIEGLKTLKQKKDETLKAFYADFLESLVKCCGKLTSDAARVAVIKRLILPPGIFNIEKFTGNRIVHQLINTLAEDGVKDVFQLYKSILLATLAKNPENVSENWLNLERLNAGYMLQHLLQHKSVQASYEWREEQLKFLFTCGVFYVTDSAEICKKEAAGAFSKDFAEQCKNMFYTCLQSKLSDIQQEQQLLFNLAKYCQEKMLNKHAAKYFRTQKFDDSLQKSWKTMFDSVSISKISKTEEKPIKSKKSGNTLQSVFNILLLNMGLQLFREPEMAAPAIDDLLKCMEKTKQQKKSKKNLKKTNDEASDQEKEPEWIEVVVDLFLHLLSQNNNALRNVVNVLFPHLCDNLSLSAVHQILGVLDMKDGHNPLSTKNEDEDEDEDAGDEDDEIEIHENGKEDEESEEEQSDEDDEESDEESDEEEDEENVEDGEDGVTASDKLRNAISQALITNGSAGVDDDMESVDLNDMTEEEGRKLDEALANAFKALKKANGNASQTKKSKSYRVKTTTVLHFRIRVLDLIEIYLQKNPSLLFSIEIMLALYNMLEYCAGDELKPLQSKVEKVLTKLTAHKNYTTDDNDLKEDNFVDFIRLVVEKKAPAVVYDIVNKMRNKCVCFLISNVSKINSNKNTEKVLKLCQEYTQEFIKSRNPIVNVTLLTDIFKLRWLSVWNIADDLTQQGLNLQTRIFRRIQIFEVLSVLYKNHELQKHDEVLAKKNFKKIEKSLSNHIKALSENDSVKHSPKEFQTMLDLLLTAEKVHQRLQIQTALRSESTFDSLQNLRKHIRLESTQTYQRFCNTFKLQVIRNSDVSNKSNTQPSDSESEEAKEESDSETVSVAKAEKRKLSAKDLQRVKKQKKQQRLEAASRGLNGGIGFTQRNGTSANTGDNTDKSSD